MTSSPTQAWLKNLPASWDVKKIRALFYSRDERNTELQEDNILSVMKDIGVIRYEDKGNVGNKSSDRPENYKIVYPNDIVANSMNLVIGSLGIAKEKGVTSSVYHILAKRKKEVLPEFYEYVMRSKTFQRYAGSLGKGIMELREAVRWEVLRNIEVPSPDLDIQQSIVNHLDEKLKKIDLFIQNKERYALTLEESKKNLAIHYVLRGLDDDIEFIETGIDWLGKIPKHWRLNRLKYLCSISNGADYKEIETDDSGYPVMGSGGKFTYAKEFMYDKPSVLLGRKGTIDRPLYIDEPFWAVDTMFYTKIKKGVNPKFLYYAVLNIPFEYYSTKTALPSMTQTDLGSYVVPTPDYDEQRRIVHEIEEQSKIYDKAIQKAQQQIDLIKEYRDSLITNAVTGQIRLGG